MLKRFKKKVKIVKAKGHRPDKTLIYALSVLIIFGLVMLFSASSVVSFIHYHNTYHYLLRQLVSLIVAILGFSIISRIDYHYWQKLAGFLLFFSIILLLLVFVPGLHNTYGSAHSWINVFGFSFQPSELVKVSFLIYLATWVEAKKDKIHSFRSGLLPFLGILALISVLMMAQPDFGTLFIIGFAAVLVFFVGGGRISYLIIVFILAIFAAYMFLSLRPSLYQNSRFKCWQNPNYSALDKCYQINQSLIAVGSGGILGRGIGQSRQKFMYLPEVWGDSIFPIIAEETGFIISTLLILLYLFIFYRGLLIARAAPDIYGSVLALGIVAWLAVQTFLNIAGMINLIPMTGVPLPFISSGGSALLSSLLALGLLFNISRYTKEKQI